LVKQGAIRNARSRGFTLVEILVVVGIVMVLVGLVLPVIVYARGSARRTQCLSNLRQMAVAVEVYCTSSMGSYPPAYTRGTVNGQPAYMEWDYTQVGGKIIPGIVFEGKEVGKILQCPEYRKTTPATHLFTGYNYNTSYIGHGERESIPFPAMTFDVKNPSGTALFGEGQYEGGANKFMRAPLPNPGDESFSGRYAGTQGFRHQGMTNVVFADGHAESLKDCYAGPDSSKIAPKTGFISEDNRLYDLE
jgi:prepilin-type processing-associated H-X9-DG protein